MHEGHRQRMIEKLAAENLLQDHELLEILLFNAIPRKNTNEIAHSLIDACGGLSNVFRADVKQLASVQGVGQSTAAYLKTIGAIYERMDAHDRLETAHTVFSYRDFSACIEERYKKMTTEHLELYALDAKNKVCFIRDFTTGDRDHVELSSTDVSRFITDYKPKGIVIAHNHPSMSCAPSIHDTEFTQLAHVLCTLNNVTLVDHVIVGTDGTYSYYLSGELDGIRECYDIETMMRHAKSQAKKI